MASHVFFCNETDCSNMTTYSNTSCYDCCEAKLTPPVTHCEDCGAWSQVFPDNCCHTCHMKRVRSAPCEAMCEPAHCPGCDRELWAVLLGTSGYCGPCWQQRYGLLACETEPTHVCNGEWDYDLGYRVCDNSDDKDCPQHEPRCTCDGSGEQCEYCVQYFADKAEEAIWCGTDEPLYECQVCGELSAPGNSETAGWICDECFEHAFNHHRNCHETRETCCCYRVQCRVNELKPQDEAPQCTCNRETGLMCDLCSEEYKEPCRGCGVNSHLWTDDKYCRDCHRERYGVPEDKPVHKSLESMRAEIAEIEFCLLGNMTKGQKDDWRWILQNRRADLAEAEKEMWDQYDEDDLRKLDLQSRR